MTQNGNYSVCWISEEHCERQNVCWVQYKYLDILQKFALKCIICICNIVTEMCSNVKFTMLRALCWWCDIISTGTVFYVTTSIFSVVPHKWTKHLKEMQFVKVKMLLVGWEVQLTWNRMAVGCTYIAGLKRNWVSVPSQRDECFVLLDILSQQWDCFDITDLCSSGSQMLLRFVSFTYMQDDIWASILCAI